MNVLRCVAYVGVAWVATIRAAEESSAARALQLAQEAAVAAAANDAPVHLAKLEAAVELRADFPQLRLELAEAQTAAGQLEAAVGTLRRLAESGLYSPVERTDGLAPLRARADFQDVAKKLAGNLHPKGTGEIAFSLRDVSGLIEGIAWREKTGEFFFADVHLRAVWRRTKEGTLQRFAGGGEELLGVFALAIDEAGGAMWAATAAVPAMRGFSPEQDGTAALAEIDLETGAVRRVIAVTRPPGEQRTHVFRTVAIAEDGGVIVVDRDGRRVWRLAPGAPALAVVADSVEFFAPQGLALLPGGLAVVADQINGLLRVDLATGDVRRIEAPAPATFVDFTGLTAASDGALLAVQSGMRPNRVWRLELDATADAVVRGAVLESGHLAMSAPALGCLGPGGDFFYIGNAGWSRFARGDGVPAAPRPVPVFRTKTGGARR